MSRRSTTRPASASTCASCPIDSIQAAADLIAMKQAGCTKVAVANDKEAYGAGLGHAAGAGEGRLRRDDHQQHRHRPDGAELPLLRARRSRARAPTASSSPASSPTAACRSPRTSTPRCRRPRSSARDGMCTELLDVRRRRAACRPAIDPLIQCTVATQDLAAYPGGKDFLAAYKAKYGVGQSGSVRHLRLRGDEARARHDRQARRPGRRQGRRARRAVRDDEP